MNHEDGGFDCPGCAWPDDPTGLHLDICENGIKHVTWELTRERPAASSSPPTPSRELAELERLRARGAGPARRADASTTPRPTSTCRSPGKTRSRSSARRCAALESPHQASFYTSGRLEQRGDVPLPALGARVRHEQPARLLEHVPRGERPGADGVARHRQGHRRPRRLGKRRRDLRDGRQRRLERAADADLRSPRRDRRGAQLVHINPLIEAASRRTIVPHEFVDMATFHATKTGTLNVQPRIGGDMALLRGVAKAVLEAAETDPKALDREFLERPHARVRGLPRAVRRHAVGRARAPVRRRRGDDPQARRALLASKRIDHRLVPRHHPAGARRRHGPRDRQPAAAARQHRPRGRRTVARSAGTATCRATAPAASTTARRGVPRPARPRSAASTRRASTARHGRARSRRCTAAR